MRPRHPICRRRECRILRESRIGRWSMRLSYMLRLPVRRFVQLGCADDH